MKRLTDWAIRRLRDQRGRRVVLVSHCVLNENARYLGGAGRAGCVREILDAAADTGLGLVQMPCPEQRAWGGVAKRRLLRIYGARWLRPRWVRRMLLPPAVGYTRWVYRRLAREVTRQIADHQASGVDVVAIVAVDGSPSCGLHRTLNIPNAVAELTRVDRGALGAPQLNTILRRAAAPGPGLFTRVLTRRLGAGARPVLLAHDLYAELDGHHSSAAAALRALARPDP